MAKNLVIVESPAKAKTITKYLGKDFVVASSYGHVRDLPSNKISIDVEKSYEPTYQVSKDKEKVVKELKKLAKGVDQVYLATDEDREGEAISWHLCHILGLKPEDAMRITYTEVTEKAIKEAVNNPRKLDLNLVNAQQARRILDRLVGYELSPVLWKKIKPSLSAGRVQSVAVRLIVEREREVMKFVPEAAFKIDANFDVKGAVLKAIRKKRFAEEKDAQDYLEVCNGADFTIQDIQKKPSKKTPAAPFTTSTLQQEASRKLGYSVAKTMTIAQKLYENGFITYMRTDSVNLSELALTAAAAAIEDKFGKEYVNTKQYTNKNSNAQEAHEAIRPSYMDKEEVEGSSDEQRLYDLIRKRTLASQMSEARIEKTVVDISISGSDEILNATGEVVIFDGFLKVYKESSDEENDEDLSGLLPPLEIGQVLDLIDMTATQKFTKHPPRFTEASLVKKLEELGIGRPSTYAPTISTIQRRNYVVKESRDGTERQYVMLTLKKGNIDKQEPTEITGTEKNKLFPTDIGLLVNDFLVDNFQKIMDYSFTANIEKQFDEIATGNLSWNKMIDSFYKPFHTNVETTTNEAERVTGERYLGDDPKTGERIIARMGRYGPMVQKGETPEEEDGKKPKYAKLRHGQSIETIVLEEALELFKLPRSLGEFEEKEVKAAIGRFGPYVMHNSKFVSIPKDMDPYTISFEEAVELIQAKRKADAEKMIHDFKDEEIQVLNGRYGPYIKHEKRNYKIPKDKEAKELTVEECLDIIKNAPPPKKRAARAKKS
ncbi:MAG: type I DNA topoisomerase [Chitinophagales bacterium]|nr:type I DNA topoisomerase [Chitinophagales bacterium]